MLSRFKLITVVCLAAAIETGTQTSTWRQCLTDATPAAIDACTAIILLDPRNDGSFVNRGIAYRRVGAIELALEDYEEAIHLNPDAADAFNNRGNALRAKEEFDLAIRDYNEAIRLDPHYAHAFNNRGIVFLDMGNPGRAILDFDRAIAEDRSYANAFRNRGIARTHLALFDRALEDFAAAFALNPAIGHGDEYALALYGRGLARQRDNDPAGSEDIDRAMRLLPHVADVMAGTEDP